MGRWIEKRRVRRRQRERTEEVLAWLLVPAITAVILWAGMELKDRVAAGISIALGLSR
jgi:hypothetical protein